MIKWNELKNASIDNYNYVLTDKLVKNQYTHELIFASFVGYNNIINDINKSFSHVKEKFNVNIKYHFTAYAIKNKYKIFFKRKDLNFSHLIVAAEDMYSLNDKMEESFVCYIYYNKNIENDLENKLYDKLYKYCSIPLLKEWIPYIQKELINDNKLYDMQIYALEDDGFRVAKLEANKNLLKEIISNGLRFEHINICGNNEPSVLLNSCDGINSYLELFGESLAKKIQNNFKAKFTPGEDNYDKYTDVIDDYMHHKVGKELYEAQKSTIQSISNNWKTNRNSIICGEMGSGKTILASSATYVHHSNKNKGLNCVVTCPAHLVNNWKKEIEEHIPNAKAYIIHNLSELKNIEEKLKNRFRVENMYVIVSYSTSKLSSEERPNIIFSQSHPVKYINSFRRGRPVFLCPHCGKVLTKTIKEKQPDPKNPNKTITVDVKVPMNELDFIHKNAINEKCKNKILKLNNKTKEYYEVECGTKLWAPITECNLASQKDKKWIKLGKNGWIMENLIDSAIDNLSEKEKITVKDKQLLKNLKKLRISIDEDENFELKYCKTTKAKYPISKYIKKYMKNVFDYFIADEVHNLAAKDSSQAISFHHLSLASKKTLGLTGTILNGFADSIYYLLFRLYPKLMIREGFEFNNSSKFMDLYGVKSNTTVYKIKNGYKEKYKNGSSTRKPGISPLVFTKFLLNNTVFLSLDDMTEGLPPYSEIPIPIEMDKDTQEAYAKLCNEAKQIIDDPFYQDKGAVISQFTRLMISYPDTPHFNSEVINRRKDLLAYTPVKLEEKYRNKEQELLRIVHEKITKGEKVLIYYNDVKTSNLGQHLETMLKEENFNAKLLKSSDSTAENRITLIEDLLKQGVEVLIANPSLVETGLNLIDFTTIIFFQVGYKLDTLRQASRRSWRLSQKKPVTVYFMYYTATAQETVMSLMATKLAAAQSMEGKFSDEGLRALSGSTNILTEIANNVCNNIKNTVDKTLFRSSDYVKKASNKIRDHFRTIEEIEISMDEYGRRKVINDLNDREKAYVLSNKIFSNISQYL